MLKSTITPLFYLFIIVGSLLIIIHYYLKKRSSIWLAGVQCCIGFLVFIYSINLVYYNSLIIFIFFLGGWLIFLGMPPFFRYQLSIKQLVSMIFGLTICFILLFLFDSQYILRGTFYRLNAIITNTPMLVIDNGDDLKHIAPPKLGTLIVFSPTFDNVPSYGVYYSDKNNRLPIKFDYQHLYWGRAVADFDRPLYPNHLLLGLEQMESYFSKNLTKEAIIDIDELCSLPDSCLDTKSLLVELTGRENWQDLYQWSLTKNSILAINSLDGNLRSRLIQTMRVDTKNAYQAQIKLFITLANKAEKESFAFYNVRPVSNSRTNQRNSRYSDSVSFLWESALNRSKQRQVKPDHVLGNYYLPNGVIVDIGESPVGGPQLSYQSKLVQLNLYQLALQASPMVIMLLFIMFLFGSCCSRGLKKLLKISRHLNPSNL